MNLNNLKRNWESLAERDALGAILTDGSKAGGRWDLAEFMATGEAEIEIVMAHLKNIGLIPNFPGMALDFGCGVGRLTQSLARRFDSCEGMDISEEMIDQAKRINRFANCKYLVCADTRLPFSDGIFSFIYSNIVLQHVPPRFSEQYLREFVRILAPNGILVFGVQDSFAMPDIGSRVTRIRHVLRLRSRLQNAVGISAGNMQMHCLPEHRVRRALGFARVVDVQWTNTAAKDFNGQLVYLPQPPHSGYVGKQYCVVRAF
jgi:SAM-dependent methyltransferase